MCKILMVAGIKPEHQDKVAKILKVGAKVMSRSEDDGVGYAAITKTGGIYGEKWLNKEHAFEIHSQPKPDYGALYLSKLMDKMMKWDKEPGLGEKVYGKFGAKNVKDTVAVIMHARKATVGDKSIENTHPFHIIGDKNQEDIALIHNGSIKNHHSLTKKFSTCDSETLLHEYIKNTMNYNPSGIEDLAKTIRGEYTVGVLSSGYVDNTLIPYLDIFKSNKELVVGYCREIETAIFTTLKYTMDEIAKETGFTIDHVNTVNDGFLMRINAITGERMDDLIPFALSDKWGMYGDNLGEGTGGGNSRTYHHSHAPRTTLVQDDIEETIDDLKEQFEANHPNLFEAKYHAPAGLTEEEKTVLETLRLAENTDKRALRLVQNALGIKISS